MGSRRYQVLGAPVMKNFNEDPNQIGVNDGQLLKTCFNIILHLYACVQLASLLGVNGAL